MTTQTQTLDQLIVEMRKVRKERAIVWADIRDNDLKSEQLRKKMREADNVLEYYNWVLSEHISTAKDILEICLTTPRESWDSLNKSSQETNQVGHAIPKQSVIVPNMKYPAISLKSLVDSSSGSNGSTSGIKGVLKKILP